jgi:hypothetical protein
MNGQPGAGHSSITFWMTLAIVCAESLFLQCALQMRGFIDLPIRERFLSYYDYRTQGMSQYRVPALVQVKRYRFTNGKQKFTADLLLGGDVRKSSNDRLMYEIYFAKPGLSYELGLVAPVGASAYPSTPPVSPGRAGLVDVKTGRLIASADVKTRGNRISISCTKAPLAGKLTTFGIVRYAPESLTDARVAYGQECIRYFTKPPNSAHTRNSYRRTR